jgi:2-iminobutanoate/2-iminopropanoate deaminase
MREVIHTDAAPAAIGPYSQGVRTGDLLFVSGQIAINPKTGDLIDGEVGAQTEQCLRNAAEILIAGGSGLDQVVKTTVYLLSMADFGRMNEIYALFFGEMPPARATIAVAELPKGALVEIDFIARVPGDARNASPLPRGSEVAKAPPA